jgi:hypothetical protein
MSVAHSELGMSWAFVTMATVLFVGALLWGLLNAPMHNVLDKSTDLSDSSDAETGADRVQQIWTYWPLWFGGGVLVWGYFRAVAESRRGV